MVDYICDFQDSYVYSHLFENNLVDLVNKGVKMERLFNSKIFQHTFDFDEWPATNSDTSKVLKPYNKSIFKLRYEYSNCFSDIWKRDEEKEKKALEGKIDLSNEKVYKIKYNLNILTSMSEKNG